MDFFQEVRRVGVLLIVLCLTGMLGCAEKKETSLPGAVYANQVGVYASATYDGTMGGSSLEQIGGPVISESQSWFFKTHDPAEKLVAFYEQRLPRAEKRTVENGEVTFTLVPAGAEEGEQVVVTIRSGEFQITESLKPGKRKG